MEPEEIEEYLKQTEYNTRLPYGSGIKRQKALEKASREKYRQEIAAENMAYSGPIANVGRYFPNDSVYDEGITIYDIDRGINTYRDTKQSDLLATGNALLHGGTALGAGILGTALLTNPYGLAAVAGFTALEGLLQSTKEDPNYNPISWFTNNAIFKVMDSTKSFIDEMTPVYTADTDKEGLAKFAGLAGFDALSQGIGFLVGGVGGARMAGKKLSEGSKFYDTLLKVKGGDKILQGKTIEEAARSGLIAAEDIEKIRKAKDFADGVSGLTASVVGRIGESVIEAQGTKNELLEKGYTESEADAAMNKAFLANMALSSVDYIQNIKMLGTFKNVIGTEAKLAAYSDDVIKAQQAGKKAFTKGDKALSVLSALGKNAVLEGGEEGLQFAINKAAQDSAIEGNSWLSFLKNMGSEFQNSFTDEEGQLGWILGGLLGGGASSILETKNIKVKDKELANIIADAESLREDLAQNYKVYDNGLYSIYTKPDGSKEKVINQDYINTIHHNSELEAIKRYAEEKADSALYNVAQNKQVMNKALFALKTNNFKNFVTELETSKDIDIDELRSIKALQENKPINEVEVTKEDLDNHVNSVEKALSLINSLKTTYDAAMTLPQIANLPATAIFKLADVISSQKSIAKELENIKPEMLSLLEDYSKQYEEIYYTGKKTGKGKPDKRTKEYKESGLAVALDAIQDPILREQFKQQYENYKDLNAANKVLLSEYESYLKEPKKLIKEAAIDEVNKIKTVLKETSEQTEKNEKVVDDAVKNKEEVTVQTPEGEIVTKITGVNPETGQIETEAGIDITPDDIIAQKAVDEEEPEQAEAYDYEDADTIFQGPKKVTIYSTSTSAQVYDNQGRKIAVFTGSPWNELQYQFRDEQYHIVKYMADPANTPSKTKTYTAQLNLRPITEDLLKNINSLRAIDNLPALSMEELNSVEYMPIGISIYENGKLASADITPFHDIDYFRNIARFDELSPEDQSIVKENFKKERQRIIDLLKKGTQVKLKVENKSNGIPNYNPPINGKRQVNPINKIFSVPLLGRTSGVVPVRGLGVVTEISEDTYEITFENGSKQTYALDAFTSIEPVKGKVVFETVSANNSPYLLDAITFNEVNAETQQAIATLFTHRLFNGNEIKLGKTSFDIIAEGTGLLNNLVYLGERKSAREKQIFFKKDGTLVVGKKEFTSQSDPADVKDAVFNHLTVHHKYPKYPLGAIRNKNKIILPTEIDNNGVVTSNIPVITMERYLFGATEQQPNPLIGTNINSNVNFINSYFSYAKGPDGLLELTTNEPKEKPKPFAEDLSKESTKPTPTIPVSSVEKSIRIANLEITQKVNSKGNIEREIKNVDNGKSLLNVITPEGKSMFFSLPNLNEAIDNQSQAVKDVIGNVDITKKLAALEGPSISDKKTNPVNWKKGDEIIITVSGRKVSEYKTKIIDINTDGTSFSIQYKDASGNIKTIDNIDETGVFEEPFDNDNGIFRSVELAALEGAKPVETIENVTETAKELNKDCNGVGGNKPIEKGPGGGIDLNDMFK
jgi:hypothetical protein